MSSAAPGAYFEYLMYFMAISSLSLVELAPRHPTRRLARVARLRSFTSFGEITALFAAVDAFMRPQPFENKLRSAGDNGGIVLGAHIECRQVVKEALNLFKLRHQFRAGSMGRDFELAAQFEPLHDRLEICTSKILRERLAHSRAD